MKSNVRYSARFISAGLCLLSCLLANRAGATLTTWDPQGTSTQSPFYTGSLSGNWEDNNWAPDEGVGVATPGPWVENTAAEFAVNSGTGTPAFTVTMNANHTVAGMFSGPLTPNPCVFTIQGTGTMLLPAGLQGFDLSSNTSDPGIGNINVVMADADPAHPCEYTAENTGQVSLNGANTWTGGTLLGYSGASFTGILNFNSSSSFGTGGICISNTSTLIAALVAEGTAAITIPNNITNAASALPKVHIVAPSGGLTFSGEWDLNGTAQIGAGVGTVTQTGVMKGPGGFATIVVGGPSTFVLAGANTFTGSVTNVSGTLQANSIADSPTANALGLGPNLTFDGGTFRYSGAGAATTTRSAWLLANSTLNLPAGNLTLNTILKSSASGNVLTNTGAGTLILGGNLDNASLAVKVNAGKVVLNKASSASVHGLGGATTVSGGTLQLSGTGGDQIFNGVILTVSSGVFDMNGQTETITSLSLAGTGLSSGGALVNSGASTTSTLTGTANPGINLTANSSIGGVGNITVPSVIGGAFALNYVGSGVLTLSGANTYSGATTVSSGTLLVASPGSLAAGSAVTVNSGATLSGTGAINGPATVDAGGTLSLVDGSINPITFGSSLALSGTTSLEIEEDIQVADSITMTAGTVTLGGNLTVVQLDTGDAFALGDTFYLFSGTIAGTFSSYTLPDLGDPGLAWDTSQLAPGGNGSIAVVVASSTPPQSTGISPQLDGSVSLTATGAVGTAWSLHASDNVTAAQPWPVIQSGAITVSPFTVNDPDAASHSQRFYRFSTP